MTASPADWWRGATLYQVYPRPFADNSGYDVSDLSSVDPMFGTLAGFDAQLARAHALGLKIVIDQVWSHTAREHPRSRPPR